MKYQGPESFRDIIESSYQKIMYLVPRDEIPHVIVGGIGKVYNAGQRVITNVDDETSPIIDRRFREVLKAHRRHPSKVLGAIDAVIATCNDANTSRPKVSGEYNNNLDVVIFPPDRVAGYALALKNIPLKASASRGDGIVECMVYLNFPHLFAHEMIHWSTGDTQYT